MHQRPIAIAFHWTTAALVVASFAVAWFHGSIEDPDARIFWLDVHRSIGLAILVITALRLVDRLAFGPAVPRADLPAFLNWASRLSHLSVYAALLAMPLLGWAQSSARAHHFKLFGVVMPAIVSHNVESADRFARWHETGAWLFLGLLSLHAAAAFYHHFLRKDDLLRHMLGRPVERTIKTNPVG